MGGRIRGSGKASCIVQQLGKIPHDAWNKQCHQAIKSGAFYAYMCACV